MRVLLPAPFSPSRAWISPLRSSKSTPSLATTPGKRLTMPRISTASGLGAAGASLMGWLASCNEEARDERVVAGLDIGVATGEARR